MVGAVQRSGSLFYVAFAKEASLIKDDLLDVIDTLLDNPELIDLVRQRLQKRRPRSRCLGRPSIAPDRLLRCCALKHIKGWSFRTLERELRNGLVYRKFTRFDDDPIPDFSVFSRTFSLLDGELAGQIHRVTVLQARADGVATGRRLRTDTTVSESNIHHPTDSTLLADGVRVLQRALKRICGECAAGSLKVVDHGLRVKRRVLEIHRAAKSLTEGNRCRLKQSYEKLVAVTCEVVKQAETVSEQLGSGTEFGRLVRIDQAENGIVGSFAVAKGNPEDSTQWEEALKGHEEAFGRAPEMATADRGFYSAANEKAACKRGVKRVALPARGRLSQSRRELQKQRWFRRALRWRAGIEAEVATLKHRFGMARACYKGEEGFKRAVGWSVIANNLVMIARFERRSRGKPPQGDSDGQDQKG